MTTSFATMLEEYLLWIGDTVDKIDEWKGVKHYFLLVSHNGFVFDCTFVISELERRDTFCSGFRALNVQFADLLYMYDCRLLSKSEERNVLYQKELRG